MSLCIAKQLHPRNNEISPKVIEVWQLFLFIAQNTGFCFCPLDAEVQETVKQQSLAATPAGMSLRDTDQRLLILTRQGFWWSKNTKATQSGHLQPCALGSWRKYGGFFSGLFGKESSFWVVVTYPLSIRFGSNRLPPLSRIISAICWTYPGGPQSACLDSSHCAGCRGPASYCWVELRRSGDSSLHQLNTIS